MFRIRKNFLPRKISDISAFFLLISAMPATYMFEIFIVFPTLYGSWTFQHWFHVIFGTFLMFQVTSNLIALVMVDTSIKNEILKMPDNKEKAKSWHFCACCESAVPPRSWHCQICRTCILKRDHHCIFAGCCVGHKNHRFFCVFVIYMFVSTFYTTLHNIIYFYSQVEFHKLVTLIKMICPLLMFILDNSLINIYIFLFDINVFCLFFSLIMILYHSKIILSGRVSHEYEKQKSNSTKYDLGWKKNLLVVFGKRWYLVFVSPFCHSELLMNGINWELFEENSFKNK
ncbi:probable palmitoyltransferase ZDHHC24 [Condylostylus longicornis]|uniref:probable palmitoyltransferase ZDHHC24 n=1 Tax=Condylostylus longicornis TaxID=2530218 RepID=UPI00244E525D|nr:probable palmitoyltransferase ZDHHC24 [Condylostylus longicornis]